MPLRPRRVSAPAVGVVVASHAPVGSALAEAASRILGDASPKRGVGFEVVEIGAGTGAAEAFDAVGQAVRAADLGAGVVVLADLFGGTAANSALAQLSSDGVEVVTGANLAMVLEALQGASTASAASTLARQVADAGRTHVVVANALLRSAAIVPLPLDVPGAPSGLSAEAAA